MGTFSFVASAAAAAVVSWCSAAMVQVMVCHLLHVAPLYYMHINLLNNFIFIPESAVPRRNVTAVAAGLLSYILFTYI